METSEMTHIDHAAYQAKIKNWTPEALRFTIRDAQDAIKANPEGHKAGYYADEINYCGMELQTRQRAAVAQETVSVEVAI